MTLPGVGDVTLSSGSTHWGERDVPELSRPPTDSQHAAVSDEVATPADARYEALLERLTALGHAIERVADFESVYRAVRDFVLASMTAEAILISAHDAERGTAHVTYAWTPDGERDPAVLPALPGDAVAGVPARHRADPGTEPRGGVVVRVRAVLRRFFDYVHDEGAWNRYIADQDLHADAVWD